MLDTSGNGGDLATAAKEGTALAGWSALAPWFLRPLLLRPPRDGGSVLGLPGLDGGEAEALPAIEVAKGEVDRKTMNTGHPV